jgi:PAS domain S-box-containing protein
MNLSRPRKQYILFLASLVIACGVLVLIGWQFDIVLFKSILPGITPMNPVTAVTFMLSGLWLFKSQNLDVPFFKTIATVLAIVIALVGLLHFATYLHPIPGIRLDYLFYGDKIRRSQILNLIAPNTALVFLLSGVSMLTAHIQEKGIQLIRQTLIIIALCIVYVSLLGYLFDIKYAYRFAHYTPMALTTAFVFTMLNIALFLCNTKFGLARIFTAPFSGGQLIRKVVPFLLLAPMLIGYLRLLGEKRGLYPSEFGVAISTFIFALSLFGFICLYAIAENKRHLQRLKGELQLTASEHKFRTLFNTLKEGVLSISGRGIVQLCNEGFCEITGYSEQDIKNKNAVHVFIPEKDWGAFYGVLDDPSTLKQGAYITQIFKKGGDKLWVRLKMTPLTMNDEFQGFLITIIDITQERMKQQDLKAFTASAAHDLNSPLATILMAIAIFEPENLNEEQQMLLRSISETATSMRQLLEDLLSYSRLGMGNLEKTELDLNAIVKNIWYNETKHGFRGRLTFHELPPVMGNESAVRQLYTNLISNAVKYSSKKETPQVEIGSKMLEKDLVYFVGDNGAGLSEDNLKDLFTPFKRFHANFPGNGMGLAIVKRIVEKHGGKIWVKSEIAVGTTFYFTLRGS